MVEYRENHEMKIRKAFENINGEGTKESPYIITNIHELQSIKMDKSALFMLNTDIDARETETWNQGKGFEPIGKTKHQHGQPFTGEFFGQEHTIKNLYINRPQEKNVGIFGVTSKNSSIKQINICDARIRGDFAVGSIVGYNKQGCIAQSSVKRTTVKGTTLIGGLIGWNSKESSLTEIECTKICVLGSGSVGCIAGENNGFILEYNINKECSLGKTDIGSICGFNDGELKPVIETN